MCAFPVVFASSDIRTRKDVKKEKMKEKMKEKNKLRKEKVKKERDTKKQIRDVGAKKPLRTTKDSSIDTSLNDSVEVIIDSNRNTMNQDTHDDDFDYNSVQTTEIKQGQVIDYLSYDFSGK